LIQARDAEVMLILIGDISVGSSKCNR